MQTTADQGEHIQHRGRCDEARPSCGSCRRRSVQCKYAGNLSITSASDSSPPGGSSSRTTTIAATTPRQSCGDIESPPATVITSTRDSTPAIAPSQTPNLFHLELWHHWLTTACLTFADEGTRASVWQEIFPKIATQHSHVAQLLLALSALHVGRHDSERSSLCVSTATALQTIAIDGMITDLAAMPNRDRTSSLFAGAMLLCFCNLAKGPKEGQYLLYASEAEPEWLGLLQGVKSILTEHHRVLSDFAGDDSTFNEMATERIDPDAAMPGFGEAIMKLKAHVDGLCAESSSFTMYASAVDDLKTCCVSAFWRTRGSETVSIRSQEVFGWLYRLDVEYLKALQDGKPMALVIYAHYMPLFARLSARWYAQGWADHIMDDIERRLHRTYMQWLEWPNLHARSATCRLPSQSAATEKRNADGID